MTPEQIIWASGAVVLGAAVFASRRASAGTYTVGPVGTGWADPDAPRRIRAIAAPIEQIANWHGLGDYLASIAYIESRGNPRAGTDANDNRARGWFGHRPKSARLGELGLGVDALKDERYAVALGAWYADRCRKYAAQGQVMDWLSVRRCWSSPSLVPKVHPRSQKFLAIGQQKAGVSRDLMFAPAFPSGYQWPGIDAVLAAVGRGAVA